MQKLLKSKNRTEMLNFPQWFVVVKGQLCAFDQHNYTTLRHLNVITNACFYCVKIRLSCINDK